MANLTTKFWNDYYEQLTNQFITWVDGNGTVHNSSTVQMEPKREPDADGWDGKSYNKNKTDWGTSYFDPQYETNPNASRAEIGYGKPTKGLYSQDLGGYKSFGTLGQGNSSLGVKDLNDTICGDRIILLTITANIDTSNVAENENTTALPARELKEKPVSARHPVVDAAWETSFIRFEVGNFPFYDDIESYFNHQNDGMNYAEESANFIGFTYYFKVVASLSLLAYFIV